MNERCSNLTLRDVRILCYIMAAIFEVPFWVLTGKRPHLFRDVNDTLKKPEVQNRIMTDSTESSAKIES